MQPVSGAVLLVSGMELTAGDRVKSSSNGFVRLGLADGSTIEVQPNTDLELLDFSGGIKELFRIWIGNVRLKIRKLVGAPNPYEMHTPIATIGVRGTEFLIDVDQNSVTTVKVFEGLVAVKNNQVSGDEVLVSEGKEITLYPLRPPDPPVTFEQVVAENFTRESTEEYPLLHKFLAFPDSHLDLLDNPAYASSFFKPSGRLYFYPARSQSFMRPEISPMSPLNQFADLDGLFATDERRLQGFSTRVSYAHPVGDWVLAGLYELRGFDHDFRFRINRKIPSAFGGEVSLEQIGNSIYAPDLSSDSFSHRGLFLAARRFQGQTLAFSYDWSHTGGHANTNYEFSPNGILMSQEQSRTGFSTDNRRLSVGYQRESDSLGSLAFVFRSGFVTGNSLQEVHQINQQAAPLAEFETSGFSTEIGGKWRKRLTRGLFFALFGSLTRTNLDQGIQNFRIADSTKESVFWIPSVGVGLGTNWKDRIFGALDYQYSSLRETSHLLQASDQLSIATEKGDRRDHALHGWLQFQLPWSFFAGGGFTSYWSNDAFRGFYNTDSTGRRYDSHGRPQGPSQFENSALHLDQLGFSVGRRFGNTLFAEYQLTQTQGPVFRPLSHSLLLRLAF